MFWCPCLTLTPTVSVSFSVTVRRRNGQGQEQAKEAACGSLVHFYPATFIDLFEQKLNTFFALSSVFRTSPSGIPRVQTSD